MISDYDDILFPLNARESSSSSMFSSTLTHYSCCANKYVVSAYAPRAASCQASRVTSNRRERHRTRPSDRKRIPPNILPLQESRTPALTMAVLNHVVMIPGPTPPGPILTGPILTGPILWHWLPLWATRGTETLPHRRPRAWPHSAQGLPAAPRPRLSISASTTSITCTEHGIVDTIQVSRLQNKHAAAAWKARAWKRHARAEAGAPGLRLACPG